MQSTTSIEFREISVGYPTFKIPTLKEWIVRHLTGRKPDEYFWAVRDVSLEVKRGEALGIIGRNGAGKSTLLRVAAGIITPTRGEARTHGTVGPSIEAPLRTYSTGMVARLAFAIATTIDADVVLLDEILAVGDASFREKCDERIRRFRESGATIVLVSHDLEAVRDLCARAVWVAGGQVLAMGLSDEVIDAYNRSIHTAAAPLVGAGARE